MNLPKIAYAAGYPAVPRWLTMLTHLWRRRRCQKLGHTQTLWPSCDHCGLRFEGSNETGGWDR